MSDSNERDHQRDLLARWLMGQAPPDSAMGSPETWALAAAHEGVLALLHVRLSGSAGDKVPGSLKQRVADTAREELGYSMALEAEARRTLKCLARSGTPALLLKGSALAYWAYAQPHLRACGDVDLLLPSRAAAESLADALAADGYQRARTSGDLVAYELMCTRQLTPDWAVEVDVHWRLSNSALFADRFSFDELLAESVPISSLGPNARRLGLVHALLHAAMHRASNIATGVGDRLKWLYDFVVLVRLFETSDWDRLTALARERGLAGVTLHALDAMTKTFGVEVPLQHLEALRGAAATEPLNVSRLADWRYMETQAVRSLPGWPAKLRWLWQRVFPSKDYMVYLYDRPGSYPSLMLERLKRAGRKLWRSKCAERVRRP